MPGHYIDKTSLPLHLKIISNIIPIRLCMHGDVIYNGLVFENIEYTGLIYFNKIYFLQLDI